MGRHSDGLTNYKVSTGVYVVIACLVVAVIIVVFWVRAINDNSENGKAACIAGDLTLKVAASADAQPLATELVDKYNAGHPVVRDYCVTAELADSLADAGAYITDESDGSANAALAQAQRVPATPDWPVAKVLKVGIASTEQNISKDKLTDVSYPVADNAVASALVAASLNNNSVDSIKQTLDKGKSVTLKKAADEGKKFIVTNENNVPDSYHFTEIKDIMQPVRVVALNAAGGVNEEMARAGADFGTSLTDAEGSKSVTSVVAVAAAEALQQFDTENHPQQAVTPSTAAAAPSTTATAAEAKGVDTLFLFDTSANMASASEDGRTWFQVVSNAIATVAPELGAKQHEVALWNYSSPLNPGVRKGWRENISFNSTIGTEELGNIAIGFNTGGVAQTRLATVAALNYATSYAKESEKPARVVVLTTGTADGADMSTVNQAITAAKAAHVELTVIHVGPGEQDSELMKAASNSAAVTSPDEVEATVAKLSGV